METCKGSRTACPRIRVVTDGELSGKSARIDAVYELSTSGGKTPFFLAAEAGTLFGIHPAK
jgi:hypothetical protein